MEGLVAEYMSAFCECTVATMSDVPVLENYVFAAPKIRAQFGFTRNSNVVFSFVMCGTWARCGNACRDSGEGPRRDELLDSMAGGPGRANGPDCLLFPLSRRVLCSVVGACHESCAGIGMSP